METREMNILKGIRNGLCLILAAGMFSCARETAVNSEVMDDTAVAADAGLEDDTWDNNEFNTTFASNNYYEDWDLNDDIMLDENEYNTGLYSTWDTNDDNMLDENEWNTASNDFGLENENWSEWEASGDGFVDMNEFTTNFDDNNWFSDWDRNRNSMLEEREYTDGLFSQWDRNRDNLLDENEYGMYDSYFGI